MAQLAPFDGKVTLIVSSTRLQEDPLKDPTGGWRPYIRSLDIQAVSGHHLRMISDEPHVSAIAAVVAARM
jgi:thioesterase domain-containing protein